MRMLVHTPRHPVFGRFDAAVLLLVTLLACLALAGTVRAQQSEAEEMPEAGALMLQPRSGGAPLPAVRLGTHVEVNVTGSIARTRVVQAFRNGGSQWAAATYLYPLPEEGAVDSLKMVVGGRVILGEIKRRAEASRIYEEAKAKGQHAALAEEDRPNMFVNKVANIAPGETVLIEIRYQSAIVRHGGGYSLRLPLVVGPRYVPARTLTTPAKIADALAVTAPLLDPRKHGRINPVSVEVRLDPGFPVTGLRSPSHPIRVEDAGANAKRITLAEGDVPADRDFVLDWRPPTAETNVALFRERAGGSNFLMAVVTPPQAVRTGPPPPREMIFVIDNSGSMAGESMDQAKASLSHALKTLRPSDRFNVVRFDDTMSQLFPTPVAATPQQVAAAQRFTADLDADGGTEMLPALKAALADATPGAQRLRQVVFLTDGSISDEDEMIAEIGAHRGRSRVFMIGIGSAPNTYLMTHMAEVGRGTFTHIGDTSEVTTRMAELLDRLTRPVATDLKASIDGAAEMTPGQLPDLYAGEPIVLLARGGRLDGTLRITGRIGGTPWAKTVNLRDAAAGEGIGKLWARRKVAELETAAQLYTLDQEEAADKIAAIGLAFGLVTRETSLVAVDRTPARPKGQKLREEELPLNLPKGWDFDTLFNGDAGRASGSAAAAQNDGPVDLPQTATDAAQLMESGAVLLIIGLGGLAALRRRKRAA